MLAQRAAPDDRQLAARRPGPDRERPGPVAEEKGVQPVHLPRQHRPQHLPPARPRPPPPAAVRGHGRDGERTRAGRRALARSARPGQGGGGA